MKLVYSVLQLLIFLFTGNSASQISLWIGLHDEFNSELDQNRLFNSVATGDQATFFSWDTNEPNNYNKEEHCVHIRGDHDFQWNDSNCKSLVTGFICENTASVNTCPTQGNSNGNYEFEFEVTLNNSGVINVNTLVLNDRMLMNFQNSTDVAVAHLKGSIEEILQQKHELERKLGDVMYSLKNIIFSGQANFTSVNP